MTTLFQVVILMHYICLSMIYVMIWHSFLQATFLLKSLPILSIRAIFMSDITPSEDLMHGICFFSAPWYLVSNVLLPQYLIKSYYLCHYWCYTEHFHYLYDLTIIFQSFMWWWKKSIGTSRYQNECLIFCLNVVQYYTVMLFNDLVGLKKSRSHILRL